MQASKESKRNNENNEKIRDITLRIIKKHSRIRDPLLLVLENVQETLGFVPKESMLLISSELNIPLSRVYSVVTFYNELKTRKRGKHLIRVCLGTACAVKKNHNNLDFLRSELNVEPGFTTSDGLITLETVNCFGACSMAPVIEVDGKLIGNITREKLKEILRSLK